MFKSTNDFPADLARVHRAIKKWYALHGRRDLPWRNTPDAYRVYVSEIMLQQTQVKTVRDRYYAPFLKRFPTLAVLAKADRQAVMKQWEGLGYYTRAANLHAAAQQCGGMLPDTAEALLLLPGIGRNTANAIACFGFGAKLPIMEANVRRVLCRVFALKIADERVLWEKAALLLDKKNAYDYNQAMMDIGAMACTKRAPRCTECPLSLICKGKSSPEAYPLARKAKATPVRKAAIVVWGDGKGRYYLKRRDTRFLNGLYGFPEYDHNVNYAEFGGKHALTAKRLLGAVWQTYSHFTLEAKVYLVPVANAQKTGREGVWANLKDMKNLPLSRIDHKIMELLNNIEMS